MKKLKIDIKETGTNFDFLRGQTLDEVTIKNWEYLKAKDLEYLTKSILLPMLEVSRGRIILKRTK